MPTNSKPGRADGKRLPTFRTPAGILLVLVISVFSAELLVMLALYLLRERLDPIMVVVLDAPALLLILSPVLYFLIFRPLLGLVEEKERAEADLRAEKERFRKYLDVAGVIVMVFDRGFNIRLVNRKGCDILGYGEDELTGMDWLGFLPEAVRGEAAASLGSLAAEGAGAEGFFESRIINRQGEERHVLWHNAVLTENGAVDGFLVSGEDITERKQTEKALKESEARYRLVHNTAFDGIIIADARDRIIDCNDSAAAIFGWPRDEFIGQEIAVIIPEKLRALHKNGLKRFLATGESKVQGRIIEYEGLRRNGEVFPLEIALNNFTLGGVIHFTAMIRDITERKRAERERELTQARLSQSQKMEAIGRFAGGIAHDFNNILTAIRGNAELALEDMGKEHPAHQKVDGIIMSVMIASKLTKQLLLFSRGQPFELVPLNINKVVEDLLVMVTRIIGENITISTELSPDVRTIEADEVNIEQVIMNLAVNARDAMPEGGKLLIRTENHFVDERLAESMPGSRPGEAVCLTVADTGVGMDKEIIPRIFEPFFTTKETGKGTGFGLAVVYSIVKQHNGWITVQSAPAEGTTFRICFPAVRPREAAAREGGTPRADGQGESVLLVEDDAGVREFTRKALSGHGYKVTDAANAGEALELFNRNGSFDLVLCDIILSDRSGFDLVDELLARRPGLSVVLTSGYMEGAQRKLPSGKGYRFLQKPYSIQGLLKAVSDSLVRPGG